MEQETVGRHGSRGGRPGLVGRVLLVVALVISGTALPAVLPIAPPADAAVQSAFNPPVYSAQENGAIAQIGASSMDCPTATSGCTAARAGSGSGAALNNNSYTMAFTDVDTDASTSNSSTSTLSMPAGSSVLYARLVWGGRLTAGTNGAAPTLTSNAVKFRAPGQTAYSDVTGTTKGFSATAATASDGNPYQGSLDVTAAVKAAGNGVYSVGNINAATGADRYAGWALVVAYRNPSLPLRNLTVFDGFADVTTSTTANATVDIPISGFLTPRTGDVNASFGVVGWEGDLGTTGDALSVNATSSSAGTTLSDAARPANNFFDSRITEAGGTDLAGRNPGNLNNFGVDNGRVATTNVLANGQTSTTLRLTTTGDYYYPGIVTSQIDLFTPSFNAVSKSAVDVSGNSPAQPGDTLEYTVSLTNTGADPADNAVLRDVLPAGVTYVPGSLRRTANPGQTGALATTDATGDDVGEYDTGSRTVRVRVGTGSSATAGGTLAPNDTATIVFRATVNRAAAGTTVTNTPLLDYRARTLATDYTYTGNSVDTPVTALADLAASKTGTPAAQAAGGTVTYTIGATNNGPNATGRTTLVDTLPQNLTFVSSTPPAGYTCTPNGQTVTCTGGALASGATVTIPIVARVAATAAAGSVSNAVTVSSDLSDDVPANNTASAATSVSRNADLGVTTATAPSPVVAGSTATLSATVTNNGPSTADGVVVTDAVPAGTTFVSASIPGGTCTNNGGTVSCALSAALPVGSSATAQIVVALASNYAPTTLAHSATVTSSTPDTATANNTSTTSVPATTQADVAIAFTGPTALVAGNRYTYTGTVTNNGPSDALDVRAFSLQASQLVPVDISASQGTCSLTDTPPGCRLGTVPAGATVRVTVVADAPASLQPGTQTVAVRTTTSTTDANQNNNTASSQAPLTRSSDLKVAIFTNNGSPVTAGQNTSYTVVGTNVGPSNSDTTQVTTTLPDGITPSAATYPGGTCTITGQTVTCAVGTLTPNQSVTISVTAAVAGTYPSNQATVTAAISGASPDPVPANNNASGTFGVTTAAYLGMSVAVDKNPVTAGDVLTYTYSYNNAGPAVGTATTITDDFGAGSVVVAGGSCRGAAGGSTVTCPLGDVPAGTTGTVTVRVRVAPDRAPGTLTDNASIQSTAPDPNPSNNSAQASTRVVTSADLVTTLTPPAAGPVAGGPAVTYTATVTDNGPSDATGTLAVGSLPNGLVADSATVGGRPCTITNGSITCDIGVLTAGAATTVLLSLRAGADTAAGNLPLTVAADSSVPDPTPADSRATANVAVTTSADIRSQVAADPAALSNGNLVAGTRVPFRATVVNDGPSTARQVTYATTLPAGTTLVATTPGLGTCTTGTDAQGRQVVTCTLASLAAGGTDTATLLVDVAPDAPSPLTVSTTASSTTPDPRANNDSSTTLAVVRTADLSVALTDSPDPVTAGQAVTYTAIVTNSGPSVADAATATVTLPAGLTLAPNGVSSPAGTTCTPVADGASVSCTLGTVASGGTVPIVVRAVVPSSTATGTTLTATATAASPTPDPDTDDRSATTTTAVTTSADLATTLTASSSAPFAGGPQEYVITVTNNGPSDAPGTTSTTTLPAGVTATRAVSSTGAPCTVTGTAAAGQTVTCALGTLAPGTIVTDQIEVTVDPAFTGPLAVSTSVASTGAGAAPDPVRANDTAQVSQAVASRADLAAAAAFTGDAPVAGRTATYRLSVTNNGPSVATAAGVAGALPAGTTFVSATPSAGGTCSAGTSTCTFGTLPVGATAFVDVVVAVAPETVGPLSVTATTSTTSTDPDGSNNQATATAPVARQADLSAATALISGAPVAGQEVRFQVTVRNDGPSLASGVRLVDPAVAGLRITGADIAAANGTCATSASGLDCALADLPVGAQTVVTVIGVLDQGVTTPVTTTPRVSSTGSTDPNAANDAAPLTLEVGTRADVGVSVAGPDAAVPGTPATWTVTVTNGGPSTARGVVVDDRLPDGVTLTGADAGAGRTCTVNGTAASCALGDLPGGAVVTIAVTGTVSPSYTATTVRNDAAVRSGTADPATANNTASVATPVRASADLSTVVTGPAAFTAGAPATVTVTVSDAGPSDAAAGVSETTLPGNLTNVTATTPAGTCTIANGVATCPLGVVPAGGSATVTIVGTVDPATAPATSVTFSSTARSTTPDPVPGNNTGTLTAPVGTSANLSVTQAAAPSPAVPGQDVTVTTTVRNAGPSVAVAPTATVTLPAGLTGVRASTPGGTCTVAPDGTTATCPLADLAPGASVVVTVVAGVDPAVTAPLAITGTVTSTTADPDAGDDSVTTSTPVAPTADLRIGTAITSGPPVAGARATVDVDVATDGPSTAADAVVTVPIPVGFVLDPASVVSTQGTCTVDPDGTVLRCALGAVAPGTTPRISIAGTLGQDFGQTLSVSASIASPTADRNAANNTSTSTATVGDSADLAVTAPPIPDDVVAGTAIALPVTVTNNGPSNARNVTLTGLRPPNLTNFTVTGVPAGACDLGATTVVCRLGDIPVTGSVELTISGVLAPTTPPGPRAYPIRVATDTPDPDSRNDITSSPFTIVSRADLGVATAVSPQALTPGRGALVTLTVTNTGPSTSAGTVTTDALPDGVDPSGDPTSAGGTCRITGRVVSCDLAALAPGAQTTVQIPVVVNASLATAPSVAATVAAAVTDPNAGNDRSVAAPTLDPRAALTVALTGPARITAGTPATLVATVRSTGPSDARDVVLTQDLPEGFGDVTVTPSQGSCTLTGRTLRCELGTVGAGTSVDITVRSDATLAAGFVGPDVTTTATLTSTVPEPTPGPGQPAGDGRTAALTVPVDTRADLVVGITGPDSPVPGSAVSYDVTARNDGPSVARGTVLQLAVPPGLTGVTIDAPAGITCDAATLRCTVGDLAPGNAQMVMLTVRGTLAPGATGAQTASVRATSTTTDPDPGDNTASAVGTANALVDVAVTQAVAPAPLVAGGPVTWTVTVTNAGPSTATGVTVTDTPPATVTDAVAAGPAGVTCSGLTCTLGALAPGQRITITVTGTLPADAAPGPVRNTVAVGTTATDADAQNDTDTLETPVTAAADLATRVTTPAAGAVAGGPVHFDVGVTSTGPSDARDAVVTIPIPAGLMTVTATASQGTCAVETGTLVCRLDTVAPGTTPTIAVDGVVDPAVSDPTLTLTATTTSGTADPDTTNDTGSAPVTVGTSADLGVTVTPSGTFVPGRTGSYRIVVTDGGPSVARGATATVRLPAGVTPTPLPTTCTTSGTAAAGLTVTCTLGDVSPGAPVTLDLPVALAADARPDQGTTTVTVGSSTADPDASDNTDTVAGAAAPQVDLAVDTPAIPAAMPGDTVTSTSTVVNTGPSAAPGTTVTVRVPAELTNATVTPSAGTCGAAVNGTVTCDLGTLAPNTPVRITVTGVLAEDAAGTPAVGVAASSTANDTDPGDNQTSTPITVTPRPIVAADLAVTLAPTGPLTPGTTSAYRLTVTDRGPALARNAVARVRLPAGITAGTLPTGCTATATAATGQTVECVLGDVAVGTPAVRDLPVTVAPDAAVDGTATTASVGSDSPDPTPANNTTSTPVAGPAQADLGLVTPAIPATMPGDRVTSTTTVTNRGPSAAAGTTVTVAVPGAVEGAVVTSSVGTCGTVTTGTATCDLGTLAPGASATVTVAGTLADDAAGTPALGVSVTSDATDPNLPDNRTSTPITVTPRPVVDANLGVTLQATAPLTPGTDSVLRVTVTNAGPATATGATATVRLPAGVTVGTLPAGCTVDGTGRVVTCTLGDVATGAPAVRDLPVGIAPDAAPATATATVGATSPDPDTRDDTATLAAPAAAQADLAVTTPPVAATQPGQRVTSTSTITNNGPSTATATTVSVRVPAELTGVTITPSAGTCGAVTDGLATCDLGVLTPGGPGVTVTVAGTLAATATGTPTITVSATSAAGDPVPGNNQSSTPIAVTPAADLVAGLTSPGPLVPGSPSSFAVSARNDGPSTATGATATVRLPAGVTAGQLPDGCTATGDAAAGQTVTCTLGDLASGDTETRVLPVTVAPDADVTTASATATVGSAVTDPDPSDNTATVAAAGAPQADLGVTTATVPPTDPGAGVTVTSTVTDGGPSVATNTVVTLTVPAGITNPVATITGGTCDAVGDGTITCRIATLAPNAQATVTLTGTVAPDAVGPLTVGVAATSAAADPAPGNNTTSTPVAVNPNADVAVTLTPTGPLVPGGGSSFTLGVSNAGPAVARGTVATVRLPAGVTAGTLPAGCTATGDPATGQTVTCTVGDLAARGPAVQRVLPVTAAPDAAASSATATVSSVSPDPATANNTASADAVGAASADLAVTTPPIPATTPGTAVSSTSTITNNGPSSARAVVVTVTVPAELEGATVASAGRPCSTVANGTATCDLGVLAPGDVATVTVSGTLAPDATGTPRIVVSAASAAADPVAGNDAATTPITVTPLPPAPSADLGVTLSPATALVPGTATSYRLAVTNRGPSAATATTVTTRLPVGLTAGVLPAGCTATGTPDTGQTVTCDLGEVLLGATVTRELPVVVGPDARPGAPARSTVASGVQDPATGDNTATAAGVAAPRADLAVTTPAIAPATPGTAISSTTTVVNRGPSAASGTTVTVRVPPELTGVTVTPSTGTCGPVTTGSVTCELGTLEPGASATVVVAGTLAPTATGTPALGASATSTAVDPDPTNNASSTPIVVTPVPPVVDADLGIRLTQGPLTPGTPSNDRITVTNYGPAPAREAVVTVRLPAGITADPLPAGRAAPRTRALSRAAGEAPGQTVVRALGDLASGAEVTIDLPIRVAPDADLTSAVTVATVSSTSPDRVAENNVDSAPATGQAQADLAVVTGPVPTAAPGAAVTVTSTVTNRGPSTARGAVATIVVPAGLENAAATVGGVPCAPVENGTITCALGALGPSAQATVTLTGTIGTDVVGPLAVGVGVASAAGDPVPGNNVAATPIAVTPTPPDLADLSVTKTLIGSAVAGADVSWDVAVTNAGPATARGVTLTDRLPAGISTPSAPGCGADGLVLTCDLGSLANGETRTVRVTGRLAADARGTLENSATAQSSTPDPNGPNTGTVTSTIAVAPGLSITKVADRSDVAVGEDVTWTITVKNAGPSTATGVSVVDDLPGVGPSQDPAAPDATVDITAMTPAGAFDAATLRWLVGTIPPGEQRTLTLNAQVVTPGDLTNRASVLADGGSADAPSTATDPDATGDGAGTGTTDPVLDDGTTGSTSTDGSATAGGTATSPPSGQLAYTGAVIWPVLGLAAALLALGAGLLIVARRRRQEDQ